MNFSNIQQSDIVRFGAVLCVVLGFIASLVVMVYDFIIHGSAYQLPSIVNTILTSVLTFGVAALSSHQGASISQQGSIQGATTVSTTQASTAHEMAYSSAQGASQQASTNGGDIQKNTAVIQENTAATKENTAIEEATLPRP